MLPCGLIGKTSSHKKLSEKDWPGTIHIKSLQVVVSKIFRVVLEFFNSNYHQHLSMSNAGAVYHGSESISNLGPIIWNLVPSRLKELADISSFKIQIKQ